MPLRAVMPLRNDPLASPALALSRRELLRGLAGASALAATGAAGCASYGAAADPQTLTVLLQAEPEHIDPRFPGDGVGAALSRLVYGALLESDPQTFAPRLSLAESVEQVSPRLVRAVLKPDLRFHDGSPLTSRDVAATYNAILDRAIRSSQRGTYAETFERVRVVDPRTVEFDLTGPDGRYPSLLQLGIMRERDALHPRELVAAQGNEGRFVGAGRARARSLTKGAWEFTAVNPAAGKPRALRFLTMHDPNTLALRMLHGDADVAELKPELLPLFGARPSFSIASARGVGFTYVGMRNDHPLLRQPEVRRAIAHAIDAESLRRSKFGDRAVTARGPIAPSHWAFEPSLPPVSFDQARARALLSGASGFTSSGNRLVLRVSSMRFTLTLARAVARMLGDVGFEVDVRPSDLATLLADLRAGRFDLTLLQMPDLSDPWGVGWLFATSSRPTPQNPSAGGNRWRYSNPELDAAVDAGRRASGPEARRPHYALAQQILARDLPVVPLWHQDVMFAAGPRVGPLQPRGDAQYGFLLDATLRAAR